MSENWKEEELKAAVIAYIDMRNREANGEKVTKKNYYTDLSNHFKRTEKSYEYRMQNISYVFSIMGRTWVSGLKPAKNVGTKNVEIIERLISEVEGQTLSVTARFETQVSEYKNKSNLEKPIGINGPTKSCATITQYDRDPHVKAWILKNACGICEVCNGNAPFETVENEPFLEVHHLRRLADGGSDTISNTIALCPNCHRKLHYGSNKVELVKDIYNKIDRLLFE